MKTKIKRYGNSVVIVLPTEFLKFHKLKVGNWVDISEIMKVSK